MISIRFNRFALLFLVLFIVAGCSGGSDSTSETTNSDPTDNIDSSNAQGFTTELLDSNPTLYFTESDALGTFQTSYAITGSNDTYTLEVSDYEFDSQDNLTSSFSEQYTAELQADGTLLITTPDGSEALDLLEVDPNVSWVVTGPDDVGTWTETWYYNKPADWVQAGTPVEGFTTELLDANPTLYFTESDALGTFQTIYAFSGSNGTYTFEVSDYQFDPQGNLTDSFQGQFPAVLQEDGTLSVTTPEEVAVLDLLEVSPGQYWVVTGPGDAGPWEETWYYNEPADWVEAATPIEGFTTELLDANPTLYIHETVDEGIDQTIVTITGSNGTYTLDVSEYEFYDQGNLTDSWAGQVSAQLQGDGTLLVLSPEGPLVLDLLEVSPTEYWLVTGEDEFGPWTEYWNYDKPADWIEVPSSVVFTSELLNTNPTLYFSETDEWGIWQTIYTITGSNGTYTLNVSDYGFDLQGNLTDSFQGQFPAVLQEDGTLSVTTPEEVAVLELLEVNPNVYWMVSGPDEFGTWKEYWNYNKPADWIEVP